MYVYMYVFVLVVVCVCVYVCGCVCVCSEGVVQPAVLDEVVEVVREQVNHCLTYVAQNCLNY